MREDLKCYKSQTKVRITTVDVFQTSLTPMVIQTSKILRIVHSFIMQNINKRHFSNKYNYRMLR